MEEFKDSTTALVADVDCTADGRPLCTEMGIRSYPTIKWGDPRNMSDYWEGRDYDSMKKFAETNLGPTCGPTHLDLCDDVKKAEIEKFLKMSAPDLDAVIEEKNNAIGKLQADLDELDNHLLKVYTKAQEINNKEIEEIKGGSSLELMKIVSAHNKAKAAKMEKEEEEEEL